ncbi:MAG: electron transfer flavoprotein subunit alpha/FixB family protein [Salinirussus sp.]
MPVLALAEHRRGELRDPSYEIITAGRELADAAGTELHLAVVGGDVDGFAESLNREGVDVIHTVDHGEEFVADVAVQAIEGIVGDCEPEHVLVPNTVNGLSTAPAVADRLERPLATDAIEINAADGVVVTRETYGGKTEATVEIEGDATVLTVRPGEWPAAEGTGDAVIEAADVEIDDAAIRSTVEGFQEVGAGDVDITEAEVLVSIGRGIEEEDNIVLIEALADALDATVSASRPIVDNDWLPKDRQVGQYGKTVQPEIYIAIGISGAVQHVAGMKGSDTIIAINTDPSAPIYDIADFGIVDDLFDVVPALIEEFGGEVPDL